jgi:small neutral amino acid transporter SnatA (MarC family)
LFPRTGQNDDRKIAGFGRDAMIATVALSCYLFLILGAPLQRRLGPGAMGAINRIFGFLIPAIAVLVWERRGGFQRLASLG